MALSFTGCISNYAAWFLGGLLEIMRFSLTQSILFAELRLGNSGLSVLSCGDVTAFLNRLSSGIAEARQQQREQLKMTLVSSDRPYKYLDSYAEMDSDLFRGRANDVSELFGSIIGNEAVVLFGNSGVGKTSLLEAGIAPKCHAQGLAFVKMRIIPDPLQAVCSALNLPVPELAPSGKWLSTLAAEMKRRKRPAVVVAFDQFEEFFSELSTAVQSDFWDDLALARVDKSAQFHFVFSIRQEALYLIKNAFPALPKPYALTYSLERMSRTQQKESLKLPRSLLAALGIPRLWTVSSTISRCILLRLHICHSYSRLSGIIAPPNRICIITFGLEVSLASSEIIYGRLWTTWSEGTMSAPY